MFDTGVLEKISIEHFYVQLHFSANLAVLWENMAKYAVSQTDRPQMAI